jgi:hypothetical protein
VVLETELPHLAGGGATRVAVVWQCSCHLTKTNRSDHLAQTGNDLPHVPNATCPVDRRNKILLTSQSSGEIMSLMSQLTPTKKSLKMKIMEAFTEKLMEKP